MRVAFAVAFTLLMVLTIGCAVLFMMGFPRFGVGVPVFLAAAVLVELLERTYTKAAGLPTFFERAMPLKNQDNGFPATREN